MEQLFYLSPSLNMVTMVSVYLCPPLKIPKILMTDEITAAFMAKLAMCESN